MRKGKQRTRNDMCLTFVLDLFGFMLENFLESQIQGMKDDFLQRIQQFYKQFSKQCYFIISRLSCSAAAGVIYMAGEQDSRDIIIFVYIFGWRL